MPPSISIVIEDAREKLGTMKLSTQHTLFGLMMSAAVSALTAGTAFADNFGKEISNVAVMTYVTGETTVIAPTNEVVFTVQPPRLDPVIQFFRYSPNAASPQMINVNGSEFSPSGSMAGPFQATVPPTVTGQGSANKIDFSAAIPVIPADTYLAGEYIFVSVDFITANLNSDEIDTLVIAVDAANESGSVENDKITLRLYESSANSGVFWAYVPSSALETPQYDPVLSTPDNTSLKATYIDENLSAIAVVDTAVVNPKNTVFDSVTGAPVNGAEVTLIDLATGQGATVFGVDGFSEFPSTLISGDIAVDDAGLEYKIGDGAFTFPVVEAGQYAIEVVPPEGYSFASVLSPDQINQNTGAGYFIVDASFGRTYELEGLSALRFDIPLDPSSELSVTKVADRQSADVGDFVGYTVQIENRGKSTTPIQLFDTLPVGFRYVAGTSQKNGAQISDPVTSDDAALLTYGLGVIAPGEIVNLNYALEIGPGGFSGDGINRAVVRDGNGNAISNIGRAEITLREDLLRSKSTIIGRVAEQACDAEENWAREITHGVGVEGVRLYMETGAYAVSDKDGLFHFEGISEGTHVVQVDEETLPQGFEPIVCEENTRYAGRATSMFVDAQGGGIWRANFYLRRTGDVEQVAEKSENITDQTEYKQYDRKWLGLQTPDTAWVYPQMAPSIPSANIGIKHGSDSRIELQINGQPVSKLNYDARDSSAKRDVFLSRWRGVDLLDGRNHFVARVTDLDGNLIETLEHDVYYSKNISRATALPDRSVLIADGRTAPELAVRLEDASGNPVHAGLIADISVETPYNLFRESRLEGAEEMTAALSAHDKISVGTNGIAKIKLEPTLRTGKVTVNVTLTNGRIVPIYMYLAPEKRDWIVVGLAEGMAGYENISRNTVALKGKDEDIMKDGRVAFFAKGLIKGNWLMTLAVDTDKRQGDQDGDFLGEIDPNAYYTLYGDRSYQEFEGVSRYPVFVKLEKQTAYAMFGDFDTDITEGRLTAYNRTLSGLKAEYLGEKLQVLGFAAETNQGFGKDEIAADGTSGTYQLSSSNILAQSEDIVIETRDRNRPDIIIDRKVMIRYLDYHLDYLTGKLVFKLPVNATDFDFNPNVIVANYETSEDAERNITYGGRVQTQIAKGKVEVGGTFVSENGSALSAGSKSNIVGVDVVAQVTSNTEVRAEYAISEDKSSATSNDAILAEIIHTSENFAADAYFREEDNGFGLGQTNSNTQRVRRYGANANFRLEREDADKDTGKRAQKTIEASAYREENLSTGDIRDSGEVSFRYQNEKLGVTTGLRATEDKLVGQDNRKSVLALAKASYALPKIGATVQVSREQPLGGNDSVSSFPARTTIGIDKTLFGKANLQLRHDILDGESTRANNTAFGVTANTWKGASVTASADRVTNESGKRLGATIGLDQQVRLSEKWTLSLGARNRNILSSSQPYQEVAPDAAISPFEVNEDFYSGYVGAGYSVDNMAASARLETRRASEADTWIASGSVARELSETLSLAGTTRATLRRPGDGLENTSQADVRLGAVWRPRGEGLVIFDRLDVAFDENAQGEREIKVVNNFAANAMLSDRLQATINYGVKHVKTNIAGQTFSSFNQLLGGEARYDVTKKIDLGLHGTATHSASLDTLQYSFGPSVGVTPVDNVWVSLGYNIDGFIDDDFQAAEFTRQGVYLNMRFKFDQETLNGLLNKISP